MVGGRTLTFAVPKLVRICACLLFFCFSSLLGVAQDPKGEPEKPESVAQKAQTKEAARQRELERQLLLNTAFRSLLDVAEDANQWQNSAASARVQSQVADLVWDFDAITGRACLVRAWNATNKIKQADQERSQYRNNSLTANVRRDVLLVARKRAPDLNAKWLEQITNEDTETDKKGGGRGVFDDRTTRSTVLLQMALSLLPQNPKGAADLAIQSLLDGISFGLQPVLIGLQEKEPALAQMVFRAALARAQTADLDQLFILYAYLYTPGRTFAPNTTSNRGSTQIAVGRSSSGVRPAADLYPEMALEFLKVATDLILNAPPPSTTQNPEVTARVQVSLIHLILSRVSEKLPQQASALMAREATILADAHFSPSPSSAGESNGTTTMGSKAGSAGTPETLKEIAEHESNQTRRDILYARAALAAQPTDFEYGFSLAQKIDDETLRINITDWITYRATQSLVKAKDFSNAYRLLIRNRNTVQRAVSLILGAQALVHEKDNIAAREWLNDAAKLLRNIDVRDDQVRVAFGIVAALGQFDQSAAIDALSSTVKLINSESTSSYDTDRAPSNQRFSLPGVVTPDPTYDTKGFGLQSVISTFAPEQFETVLDLLRRIERPEVRGSAIVALCGRYILADITSHNPNRSAPTPR